MYAFMMGAWVKASILVIGVGVSSTGCAGYEPDFPLEGSVIEKGFPRHWESQILLALEEFKKVNPDTSCFYVVAGKNDVDDITPYEPPTYAYGVSFLIKRPPPPPGKIRLDTFGPSPCGYGMTFEFDEEGKLIGFHYLH